MVLDINNIIIQYIINNHNNIGNTSTCCSLLYTHNMFEWFDQ